MPDSDCRDYDDLNGSNAGRCEGVGDCKDANTEDCTVYENEPATTDCGDCQLCDGDGTCEATFCEEGDTCADDKCRYVISYPEDGPDCDDYCSAEGDTCVSIGSDAAASNGQYLSYNGGCQLMNGDCSKSVESGGCPPHNCLCERP
jgi:hypothetical protein